MTKLKTIFSDRVGVRGDGNRCNSAAGEFKSRPL